ncbi:hypothetical protein ROZALSC1DRAFT_26560 [Rozella allomycis CSF55]|uniref:Non-specific serine/threonine protein kinase n=1 Tax=Rozella allomycis (strain CSF55) TaxID=988480 RepID=A0A4P9YR10_ROZAC|nr:hypothetical protein ROZALSC1DRAFT_26560 [Rozella allomycis CSF55]
MNAGDISSCVNYLTDIRASVDSLIESPDFVLNFQSVLQSYFAQSVPVFIDNYENKLRHLMLEIMNHLPCNESVKQNVGALAGLCMGVIENDNEENALVALRVFVDFQRNFRPLMEDRVQPFLDFVIALYDRLPELVNEAFEADGLGMVTPPPVEEDAIVTGKSLIKSRNSFKVLTECPIIIVILFQLHRKFVNPNIQKFVEMIVKALRIQVSAQVEAQNLANKKGKLFSGVSLAIKNRGLFTDLISAQIKTMSFLAYILRSFASVLKPHQNAIPTFIIQLLQNCPPEASGIRKELLVALRHILSTEFRQSFIPHLKILLDSNILIGTGNASYETLRPLAYSLLADFIHHVRLELPLPFLVLTISVYTKNLHDSTISGNIQTMSAKLLVNLVDCIVSDTFPVEQKRPLLIKILSTFVDKFTSLKEGLEFSKKNLNKKVEDEGMIKISQGVSENVNEPFRENKFLLRTLVSGMKNILYGLKGCNPGSPQQSGLHVRGFSAEESDLFMRLFVDGIECFDMYAMTRPNEKSEGKPTPEGFPKGLPHSTIPSEEKELMDQFALSFTVIDPALFCDVLTSCFEYFIEKVQSNVALLTIPQYFLTVGHNPFPSILLRYLMNNLEEIGKKDELKPQILLRLFKLVFMSVNAFAEENEGILRPHISDIITNCLKMYRTAEEPLNYFILLRSLFRSIGGGKYEALYKEVLPLLPLLLETFNMLIETSERKSYKELFVELCLTVPVRLSVLLPYLSLMMRPLVTALKSNSELVSQGLRTLELCIDNLTQVRLNCFIEKEFLDPILAPVSEELMSALWCHLKPLPYNSAHASATVRIFGKLGGRNRRLFKNNTNLSVGNVQVGIEMTLNESLKLPMDELINVSFNVLKGEEEIFYKRHAFNVVKEGVMGVMNEVCQGEDDDKIGLDLMVEKYLNKDLKREIKSRLENLKQESRNKKKNVVESRIEQVLKGEIVKNENTSLKKESKMKSLELMMKSLFYCSKIEELKEEAVECLKNVYKIYGILKVREYLEIREFNLNLNSEIKDIEILNCLNEILVEILSNENSEIVETGKQVLILFYEIIIDLFEKNYEIIGNLSIFYQIASSFCTFCYKSLNEKRGGCRGLKLIVSEMYFGNKWIWMHEMKFTRALLYILKDDVPDFSRGLIKEAKETLKMIFKVGRYQGEDKELKEGGLNDSVNAERKTYFNQLICLLVAELSNSNEQVRETIKESVEYLSELYSISITEMFVPVKDRLLMPIFAKPLRALPFPIQIGYIEAVNYCMKLKPSLLNWNEELLRLIHEALALADAEDHALVSKSNQPKSATLLTKLRVSCLLLLSCSLEYEEMQHQKQLATRNRIISIFFKSLYARSGEIVLVAKNGLGSILGGNNHKIPKDLLQVGLRPVLMNLSDHKRLTVQGLEGLARLLELLTSYFKVEIGKKLLEHLNQWADPNVLEEASKKSLQDSQEIKIISSILNIFHLLPPTANIFMDNLVIITVKLETMLKRSNNSPFRDSLIWFLQRYATEAIDYFLERIKNNPISRCFVQLLENEKAEKLRLELRESAPKFMRALSNLLEREVINGIQIIHPDNRYYGNWLSEFPQLLNWLQAYFDSICSNEGLNENLMYSLRDTTSPMLMLRSLIIHSRNNFNIKLFYSMFRIVDCNPTLFDQTILINFISEMIPLNYKEMLNEFWTFFVDPIVSNNQKLFVLKWMLIPTIKRYKIDAEFLEKFKECVWNGTMVYQFGEIVLLNVIEATCILLYCVPEELSEYKKDIGKFVFSLLGVDDPFTKQAAFVAASYYIKNFETPIKLVLQIINLMLKASPTETRHLIRQSLNVLLSSQNISDLIKVFQSAVIEEAHLPQTLMMVWQVLVSFPDAFYEFRSYFIPCIVNSLSRIGLTVSNSVDSKMLTVELVAVIYSWLDGGERGERGEKGVEKRDEKGVEKRVDAQMNIDQMDVDQEFELNLNTINLIVNYLVKLSLNVNKAELFDKCCLLVGKFIKKYPSVTIQINNFEKIFVNAELTIESTSTLCDALKLIETILKVDEFDSVRFVSSLDKCFERLFSIDYLKVNESVLPIFEMLIERNIISERVEEREALNEVEMNTSASADVVTASPTTTTTNQSSLNGLISLSHDNVIQQRNLNITLTFLSIYYKNKQMNEQLLIALLRILMICSRDLQQIINCNKTESNINLINIASTPNLTNGNNNSNSVKSSITSIPSVMLTINTLILLINLCSDCIHLSFEHKRNYFVSISSIAEKSNDKLLLKNIFELIKSWIVKSESPTIKEKAQLMLRLLCLEKDKELFKEYLLLVYEIYKNPIYSKSELTVRLEPAFVFGLKNDNYEIRNLFFDLFDASIPNSLNVKLKYILSCQNWSYFKDYFYLNQIFNLLLRVYSSTTSSNSTSTSSNHSTSTSSKHSTSTSSPSIFQSIENLLFCDKNSTCFYFTELFKLIYSKMNENEKIELKSLLVTFLSKEYHIKSQSLRPNVIQCFMNAISQLDPIIPISCHLVKYLAKTFNCWYSSIIYLEKCLSSSSSFNTADSNAKNNSSMITDVLSSLYNTLSENDMFYGLWRRRSIYTETNVALSFEQFGMWKQAQEMYESVQNKARAGHLQFTESEYYLWEERWIDCTRKLQQWELLNELGKHENNSDLLLDAHWHNSDWIQDKELILPLVKQCKNNQKRVYDAFLNLLAIQEGNDKGIEFQRQYENGIQTCLIKWHSFPNIISSCHIPLLVEFQQWLELNEAFEIYQNFNSNNKQQMIQNVKGALSTWRDRLPNIWDDISIWSDLVAWRQHVYNSINKVFQPFASEPNAAQNASFAFRGYHEIAWIINRFAHVARKHQLNEVCVGSLNKIYTLPNIEIQDAFLKLREQTKCFLTSPEDLPTGLRIINDTNLGYFANPQKAEFFTLKGIFLSKMNIHDEANKVFQQAVHIDMNLPVGWAAWGHFNDQRFQATKDIAFCANAVNCYLQAANIYRNYRSKKYLGRSLWLLSIDDSTGSTMKSFELHSNDIPAWQWIHFIPQLLNSLARKEAKQVRTILLKIAKTFPQAVYFNLRTINEEFLQLKDEEVGGSEGDDGKECVGNTGNTGNNGKDNTVNNGATSSNTSTTMSANNNLSISTSTTLNATPATPVIEGLNIQPTSILMQNPIPTTPITNNNETRKKHPWELTEELMAVIKTGYSLLALSMESMVDHIMQRLRATPDEDFYRIIITLLFESYQQFNAKIETNLIENSLIKVSEMISSSQHPNHHFKKEFDQDFIKNSPNLIQTIDKLLEWKFKLEPLIKKLPKVLHLENFSRYLVEFEHQKYDDVEVPGQYLLDFESNNEFIKIKRFEPQIDIIKRHGTCLRRIYIRGHDGSLSPFVIQNPAARHSRREERVLQLFRMFNQLIQRRKETRQRNLSFNMPLIIPLSIHGRIVQDDPFNVSLSDIYNSHCDSISINPDDPLIFYRNQINQFNLSKSSPELLNVKLDLFDKIQAFIPDNILSNYFINSCATFDDFWILRKQFTLNYATLTFITYIMSIGHRFPFKIFISRKTGNVTFSDLVPALNAVGQFTLTEPVPFRLSPNIQTFITTIGLEGVFSSALVSIARSLSEPQFEMEDYLSLFMRDELYAWYLSAQKNTHEAIVIPENEFKSRVAQNVELVLKRTQTLACVKERETPIAHQTVPVNQTIIDLVSCAVNPQKLCQMDMHWHPWL